MLPAESPLPLTVIAATPFTSGTVVTEALPKEKRTAPEGVVVPLAALTVAVTCVVPVDAMLLGLAASVVLVATGELAVTATTIEPVDAANPDCAV